jgi:MoxR-like ATPase
LILGAKARAAVAGRFCADRDGVRSVAKEVLQHRILTNFHARTQKVSPLNIIERVLKDVEPEGK